MKIRPASLFTTVFCLLIISGCAHQIGRPLELDNVKNIQKGKTTKEQLISMFGKPYQVNVAPNGDERWTYLSSRAKAKPSSLIAFISPLTHYDTEVDTERLLLTITNGVVTECLLTIHTKEGAMVEVGKGKTVTRECGE